MVGGTTFVAEGTVDAVIDDAVPFEDGPFPFGGGGNADVSLADVVGGR